MVCRRFYRATGLIPGPQWGSLEIAPAMGGEPLFGLEVCIFQNRSFDESSRKRAWWVAIGQLVDSTVDFTVHFSAVFQRFIFQRPIFQRSISSAYFHGAMQYAPLVSRSCFKPWAKTSHKSPLPLFEY